MKKLLTLILLLIASLFAQNANGSEQVGNWRGLLELAPGANLVLGIEITSTDGKTVVYLDSPNQGMVDHPVKNLEITLESVRFDAPELNASFTGSFKGNQLEGVFTQGRAFDITLTQLSSENEALLKNETRWFGDIMVTRQASLPLVLNIAVLETGYFATLDSPDQQSFGIPLTDFSLSEQSMSFKSPLINASYQAKKVDDGWEGTFVQGAAMPLNLKKNRAQR